MPATSPAWLGLTRPCSNRRCEPSRSSTICRTASASRMVSGSLSRRDGTNDSTIMSVSLSRNTSLMKFFGPRGLPGRNAASPMK